MALTPLHINDICMSGNQCRYLCWETVDGKSTAMCMKQAPAYYRQVKRDMEMYGVDLDKRGDNCQGYLMLKHHQQGYDVK